MTFTDGGPPYSEDEDLHSPVVTTARHKKNKSSSNDRSKNNGENRGSFVGMNRDGSETYYVNEGDYEDDMDGPGGELVTYPPDQARHSHYVPNYNQYPPGREGRNDEGLYDETDSEDEEQRFSRNYSFTIASPDEEMHGKAVALFDFASEHENELPLKEGQVILVSYRHGQGWLVAEDPKTGESGLVPEEFVRLLRDIEGGLHGLQRAQSQMESLSIIPPNGNNITGGTTELLSPVSPVNPESIATPTASSSADWPRQHEKSSSHNSNISNGGGNNGEKIPAVQSTFSTSSKDLDPYPLHGVSLGKDKEKDKEKEITSPDDDHDKIGQRDSNSGDSAGSTRDSDSD
ncbi:putative sh3 domain-containing protein [Phaeomoniella chlamydospora]|uniref:Putative sh3 domain-containing protein n=1 Tax=Phaeomoniella chlamydospora TaxID=158046 RepID=A0A0G2ED22_PHACM|nr:putative sh3 domain-containing protein [Phaeomoniella chlamydospora]